MSTHPVIPILDEQACVGRRPLREKPPQLLGQTDALQDLIEAIQAVLQSPDGPIEAHVPVGAWLRSLRLEPGELNLELAAELGCRGEMAAQLAFDVLRRRLHDTDIFVRIERDATAPTVAA